MTHYDGPEMPDRNPDEFDPISEEDVIRKINEALGNEDLLSIEVSDEEAEDIKDFLVDFNVKGADVADILDIDILWRKLKGNPSLVKDFVYSVMTAKEALNHSTHPLAVSMDEVLYYADKLKSPNEIREWLIALSAPSIGRFDLDPFDYTGAALSESTSPRIRPDSTRFLGWLVSQNFLANLPSKKEEYMEKHNLQRFTIRDLGSLATINVGNELTRLQRHSTAYKQESDMEREALEKSHTEVIIAMSGIYRTCGKLLLRNRQS